jgi:hypothetical protein
VTPDKFEKVFQKKAEQRDMDANVY